jgi:hypothetical protein
LEKNAFRFYDILSFTQKIGQAPGTAFSPLRIGFEHFMALYAPDMARFQGGTVDKTNAPA